jgi:hypothetical protein
MKNTEYGLDVIYYNIVFISFCEIIIKINILLRMNIWTLCFDGIFLFFYTEHLRYKHNNFTCVYIIYTYYTHTHYIYIQNPAGAIRFAKLNKFLYDNPNAMDNYIIIYGAGSGHNR